MLKSMSAICCRPFGGLSRWLNNRLHFVRARPQEHGLTPEDLAVGRRPRARADP